MAEARLRRQGSPRGWKRFLFRAPIYLYRWHLGFLLGKRFVLLEHIGRKSGVPRSTVLEVVMVSGDLVYVAAAWGDASDWYRNVKADPHVTYQLGNRRRSGIARTLERDEARSVLGSYSDRHQKTFERLAGFMLDDPGDTSDEMVENVSATVPVVVLAPQR